MPPSEVRPAPLTATCGVLILLSRSCARWANLARKKLSPSASSHSTSSASTCAFVECPAIAASSWTSVLCSSGRVTLRPRASGLLRVFAASAIGHLLGLLLVAGDAGVGPHHGSLQLGQGDGPLPAFRAGLEHQRGQLLRLVADLDVALLLRAERRVVSEVVLQRIRLSHRSTSYRI